MSERDEQARLEARARARGWRVWRTPRSDQAEAGEADLRCLWRCDAGPCPGPARYLVAELKARGRHRTDTQRQAATDYAAAGILCVELRLPDDLSQAEALLGLAPEGEAIDGDGLPMPAGCDPAWWAAMGREQRQSLAAQWR